MSNKHQKVVITEARKAASRANGAKSKGPLTPEGKRRSSQNAVSHALLASVVTLSDEDREFFEGYHYSYVVRLTPRDQFESDCVEQIAYSNYRLRVAWQIHDRTLAMQMASDSPSLNGQDDPLPAVDRLARAFVNSLRDGQALPTLHRYMRQLSNEVRDAMRLYDSLRSRPVPLIPMVDLRNEPENLSELTENTPDPSQEGEPETAPVEARPE
ncbi:MAG: hypothetical protein JSU00_04080 [Acidobacteria bacterium]|nr:hypothetical protein [Acidobacteriota bacterium]